VNGAQTIMVRSYVVSGPFQIIQMFQAEFANKQAEIANEHAEIANKQRHEQAEFANKQAELANKLSKIAIDQQAVIVNLLLGLFVVLFAAFFVYGIFVIRRYFIKVRHSALSQYSFNCTIY
jgi:beta-lactamase regulating signal transducer with metallopeptidase domain